jgi:hypothetical protein
MSETDETSEERMMNAGDHRRCINAEEINFRVASYLDMNQRVLSRSSGRRLSCGSERRI